MKDKIKQMKYQKVKGEGSKSQRRKKRPQRKRWPLAKGKVPTIISRASRGSAQASGRGAVVPRPPVEV